MNKKYQLWFEFRNTEKEAQTLCDLVNKNYTPYMRKNHKAHYTPWQSKDGTENLFICWYMR